MANLIEDLVAQGYDLRQTHISWVLLGESTVYKVKKPVQLGFLDFSTLDARKRFCELEVELNARLAPTTYRRVVGIGRDARGKHVIGADPPFVEWAVEMRRLPDRDSAEARLHDARLTRDDVRRIAERVAAFHAASRGDAETAHFGELAVIAQNVRENFEQTRQSAPEYLAAPELAALERWQLDFLKRHEQRFLSRIRSGRIRDGHGDLRLEHCYLADSGALEIIDCIEFSERFRYGDVCADIAFLSMDFSWHGRTDLSEALLGYYAREASDYELYGVVDFYESYRAYVRGKVSSLLARDERIDAASRARAASEARKYYLLAEACSREPLAKPAVYAVGGIIATGKSTLAERLASLIDAPVVDADRTRKHLSGVTALTPLRDGAFEGHYSENATQAAYTELLRRAELVLTSNRPVILDASFRKAEHRQAARALAERHGVPFLFVECIAPLELCRERLASRERAASVSDGRRDVLDAFVAAYEPVREFAEAHYLRIDTSRPTAEIDAVLRARFA